MRERRTEHAGKPCAAVPDAPGRAVDATPTTAEDLAEALRRFAALLTDDHSTADILAALGEHATALLGVHGVGVLLREPGGGLSVATANTERGRIVEDLEAELGEGPCSVALATGEQVLEPDLAAALERYPRFAPRALDAGIRSIHALPLTARAEPLGSVDVVSVEERALDARELRVAQLLADVAVAYLANRHAIDRSTTLARQLQGALDSRILIEQAKGKLAERAGISIPEAFGRLRDHARRSRTKIHDVAAAFLRDELRL